VLRAGERRNDTSRTRQARSQLRLPLRAPNRPGRPPPFHPASRRAGRSIDSSSSNTKVTATARRHEPGSPASVALALCTLGIERVALVGAPWFDPRCNDLGAAYFRTRGFDVVSSVSAGSRRSAESTAGKPVRGASCLDRTQEPAVRVRLAPSLGKPAWLCGNGYSGSVRGYGASPLLRPHVWTRRGGRERVDVA
jgi:hypothetical protein